jgi:transcriptional regulator with XRE-family HTH domain
MTGRPEVPLPADGPVVPLARRMRELRERKDLSYREMAKISHYTAPALSTAASGKSLPPLKRVLAYVDALEVDTLDRAEIEQLWHEAKMKVKQEKAIASRRRRPAAKPTSEDSSPARHTNHGTWPAARESIPYFNADPGQVGDFNEFCSALNQILSEAEMTVPQLIRESSAPAPDGETAVQLKKTTVYDVLGGRTRPSPNFTRVFLSACGMPADLVDAWVAQLVDLHATARTLKAIARQQENEESDLSAISSAMRQALQRRWSGSETDGIAAADWFRSGDLDDFVFIQTKAGVDHPVAGDVNLDQAIEYLAASGRSRAVERLHARQNRKMLTLLVVSLLISVMLAAALGLSMTGQL